jgi:hypothetical protein
MVKKGSVPAHRPTVIREDVEDIQLEVQGGPVHLNHWLARHSRLRADRTGPAAEAGLAILKTVFAGSGGETRKPLRA